MKGVVLAGGLGTRLLPLTRVTNKHLLPVYDRPMIFFPLQALVNAGITDILVVTGGNNAGDFLRLLGNGKEFGLKHLNYTYQEGEGGIAAALSLAEHFADGGPICVMLGDNVIERSIVGPVARFTRQAVGAQILLKEVPDPQRFGVPELRGDRVVAIEEKPARPKSRFAVTGIYLYDAQVFEVIRTLRPSARGELEITDVNNWYVKRGQLAYEVLEGWWTDAGTFESLHRASHLVATTGANKLAARTRPAPAPPAAVGRAVTAAKPGAAGRSAAPAKPAGRARAKG
jgi:glucose-1-phosphate thymidylyltransferase